ncbi:hypothetical protein SAMN05421797_102333 [Maribacter ulvicola]|uniref:Uncharacterized protein n=1 Tax=Maribacter ulvicola TaxID=228959 RepID=A0A1N6UGJ7_9FLAO|nr:hypothetical protein SAMN05421797_102333 [Maribacter ulvicola]
MENQYLIKLRINNIVLQIGYRYLTKKKARILFVMFFLIDAKNYLKF